MLTHFPPRLVSFQKSLDFSVRLQSIFAQSALGRDRSVTLDTSHVARCGEAKKQRRV
jgi:hypothetical protein